MYFIGVTTGSSSSVRIFPEWAETLGLGQCRLVGIDMKIHESGNETNVDAENLDLHQCKVNETISTKDFINHINNLCSPTY